MKHNKKRNVGIIYELLLKHISTKLLEGNKKDAKIATRLIEKHFKGCLRLLVIPYLPRLYFFVLDIIYCEWFCNILEIQGRLIFQQTKRQHRYLPVHYANPYYHWPSCVILWVRIINPFCKQHNMPSDNSYAQFIEHVDQSLKIRVKWFNMPVIYASE